MTMPLWAAQAPVSVVAPAKVNLFLHITGRRDNGYHELESLFAFTHQGDVVRVAAAADYTFEITGPFADVLAGMGGAGDNLVTKAALALAKKAGLEPAVAITLEKNLPVAAGIGGGSADAAATLMALNRFWKLGLATDELAGLALSLGADVPACLYHQPLLVRGIGEELEPVSLGWHAGILLVNPKVPLSTPAVFKAFHGSEADFDEPLDAALAVAQDLQRLRAETHNSLEMPAKNICPAVEECLKALGELPGVKLVRMSGSGATCFALFEGEAAAEGAGKLIAQKHPDWWVMADRLA